MSRRKQPKTSGRIRFPGNPWPKGHAIARAIWSGALVPDDGLYFDLHVESADYYAEGEGKELGEDDWRSPIVWGNYHRCTLSSLAWSEGRAVRVADRKRRFSFAGLRGRTIIADRLPRKDVDAGVFGIYLLGHDATGDHRIQFSPKREPGVADVTWRGKIALAYVGSSKFDRRFEAKFGPVRLKGFLVPPGLDAKQAMAAAAPFLADPKKFEIARSNGRLWLVPRQPR